MDLPLLASLTERLRAESVGDPEWISSKTVFNYHNQSLELVVALKLVRASQGVHAMDLLCRSGLFVDMGAIYRCVNDCIWEVYFLLESYPKQSEHVQKFVKAFFSQTIDGYLSSDEEPVQTKKIHAAVVRSLTGREQDERIKTHLTNVYKTFSGYTHAGYAHIMQMFGPLQQGSFNISGIPSQQQRVAHLQLIDEAYKSTLLAISEASNSFGFAKLHREVMQHCL
ncbi:MAG: hypothetical protein EPO06_10275 [Burkholderiaceae bacterium]|nr:MAG: hypothetical protein EPO06_10275 [Burkholderiaceae bacterium]